MGTEPGNDERLGMINQLTRAEFVMNAYRFAENSRRYDDEHNTLFTVLMDHALDAHAEYDCMFKGGSRKEKTSDV